MRSLVVTPKFRRAYRRFVHKDRTLQLRIEDALRQIESDVFAQSLGTHKLSGELLGLWACSCGYDCRVVFARVVFAIERDEATGQDVIILLDIGSHDEVY
jgi:mRNA interferase YafQ